MSKKQIIYTGILLFLFGSCSLEKDKRIDRDYVDEPYNQQDLELKPQNKYHGNYNLLIKEFLKVSNLDVIAKSKGGLIFGIPCEILGDYFTTPKLKGKYAKTEPNLLAVQNSIIDSMYDKETYTLAELESKVGFRYQDIGNVFNLMKELKIKWVSHERNIIELSGYVFPSDNSLDFYNGYFYCLNDSTPQINENGYVVIIPLENNWYYFVRETIDLRTAYSDSAYCQL